VSVIDYTKGPKSVEIHDRGILGVEHCKELLSRKGYRISEKPYRPDFLVISPAQESKKSGFRVAWCEVVRTHPSSLQKRRYLKEWMGKAGALILVDQKTGKTAIEQLNKPTRTLHISEV
jgi:hypothetical protein